MIALPTHKPILIIRDPPGGMSSTYQNVQTTLKLDESSESHHYVGFKLNLDTALGFDTELEA